jgi:6-phosphogluconolactonase (cycloisomerase 2 family)
LLIACWVALCLGVVPGRALAALPAFVYVNANPHNQANSVPAFRVGFAGEAVPLPGSPFFTGGLGLTPAVGAELVHRIDVSRSRNLLFAANDGTGTIAAFTIDPLNGSLTAVPGSPFAVSGWPPYSGISLAVSNDGRFLYASGPTLKSFFIGSNNQLFELGSQWQFSQRVAGIGVSGDNTQLFVSTPTAVFIMSTGEGGLTSDAPDVLSIGSSATDLRLDAAGKRLWVGTKSGGILAYTVAPNNVSIVPGAPFFSSVSDLNALSVDFYGRFLFAFSPTGPRLLGARSNANGSLLAAPNSPVATPFAATASALTPDGSSLFLVDAQGRLDGWSTSDDATLVHSANYPLSTGAPPGYAAVATFPDKTPMPAPATPRWFAWWLAFACAFVGARRLPPLARARH